jgi:xylose isomerase
LIGQQMIDDGVIDELRARRYASFGEGDGARFERGGMELAELAALADELGEPKLRSGKQELFESIVNRYVR